MSRFFAAGLVAGALFIGAQTAQAIEIHDGPTGVTKNEADKTFKGYTLFAPTVKSTTTYLINMDGDIVHTWQSKYPPGLYAQLLPNGNLLRASALPDRPVHIGGAGGLLEEIDWNGKVVWSYKLCGPKEVQHHCFSRMPNGNTLILAWEAKTPEEFVAKGRKAGTWGDNVVVNGIKLTNFWIDFVREVNPEGKTVWEWHVWDHLGTGKDQLDPNYRLPKTVGPGYSDFDFTHFNTVAYIAKTDQILVNSRNFSEFFIIDHKTGKIVKRWGNPTTHGEGVNPSWYDDGSQIMFGEHDAEPLENGHIQIFDNGSERPQINRSRVIEMDPETDKIVWSYESKYPTSFFSYRQGAAQLLPNGNRLVTSTQTGHLFEVTPNGEVVWEFINPVVFGKAQPIMHDSDMTKAHYCMGNMIHRAYRYAPDYPGLKGKKLDKPVKFVPDWPHFLDVYKPLKNGK